MATSVGACLIATEPEGLADKMIERRIQGVSWKAIADEFGLGSPSTARNTFKKLTGISDFKAKGSVLKKMAEEVKAGNFQSGEAKAAVKAVKAVDEAPKPVSKVDFNPKQTSSALDHADAIDDIYGKGKAAEVDSMLSKGNGYLDIKNKTGVSIDDIDAYNWNKLLAQTDGDVWKAYKLKPTSETGFDEVKSMVHNAKSKGLSKAEINKLTDVPETVVDAIDNGTWSIPGPGAKVPNIPPPPPAPPQVVTMTEPLDVGGNFVFRQKSDWDAWNVQLGSDLTSAELSAVQSYTGSGYSSINSGLRQGVGHRNASHIDRAMRPIPFDAKVIRRTGIETFRELGVINADDILKLVGRTFKDKGFMSTAIKDGVWSGSVEMHISMPAGTMGRWVQPISHHKGEMEFLLSRETPMVITKIEKIPGRGFSSKFIIHMQVI